MIFKTQNKLHIYIYIYAFGVLNIMYLNA